MKRKLSDAEIKTKFSKEEWAAMLEEFKHAVELGRDNPVQTYQTLRKIVRNAIPRLGNLAPHVLAVLDKERRKHGN